MVKTVTMDLPIDFEVLKEQKISLLKVITYLENHDFTLQAKDLEGILHLIDYIQNEAVRTGDVTEGEVFNLSDDDK